MVQTMFRTPLGPYGWPTVGLYDIGAMNRAFEVRCAVSKVIFGDQELVGAYVPAEIASVATVDAAEADVTEVDGKEKVPRGINAGWAVEPLESAAPSPPIPPLPSNRARSPLPPIVGATNAQTSSREPTGVEAAPLGEKASGSEEGTAAAAPDNGPNVTFDQSSGHKAAAEEAAPAEKETSAASEGVATQVEGGPAPADAVVVSAEEGDGAPPAGEGEETPAAEAAPADAPKADAPAADAPADAPADAADAAPADASPADSTRADPPHPPPLLAADGNLATFPLCTCAAEFPPTPPSSPSDDEGLRTATEEDDAAFFACDRSSDPTAHERRATDPATLRAPLHAGATALDTGVPSAGAWAPRPADGVIDSDATLAAQDAVWAARAARFKPHTINPKPQTLNPKHQTPNPKPQTLNPGAGRSPRQRSSVGAPRSQPISPAALGSGWAGGLWRCGHVGIIGHGGIGGFTGRLFWQPGWQAGNWRSWRSTSSPQRGRWFRPPRPPSSRSASTCPGPRCHQPGRQDQLHAFQTPDLPCGEDPGEPRSP